jgi:hypothetical protein
LSGAQTQELMLELKQAQRLLMRKHFPANQKSLARIHQEEKVGLNSVANLMPPQLQPARRRSRRTQRKLHGAIAIAHEFDTRGVFVDKYPKCVIPPAPSERC